MFICFNLKKKQFEINIITRYIIHDTAKTITS